MIDVLKIRQDFPILSRSIHGKPITYLDSTATTLKPQQVIDAVTAYYSRYTANIFRGIYTLSEEATAAYEQSRVKVADFINANADDVVFTRNTTESLNLVMYSWGLANISAKDEIVSTIFEHHSNFVPWQYLCETTGAELKTYPLGEDGMFDISKMDTYISAKTSIFVISAASNVLGTIIPISDVVAAVKQINGSCIVVVDAAQAVPHMKVDVQRWNADFVAFSGHKMLGTTGTGVLWGKGELLDQMKPFQYGGEMIEHVQLGSSEFKKAPHKFEAGTPNIAGVIGLGAAVDYLTDIGMDAVRDHELSLTTYALDTLKHIEDVRVFGPQEAEHRGGVIAMELRDVHPHDIAQILNEDNICIRAGSHCAMPLHNSLHTIATARASFYIYNTTEDIDRLAEGLEKVKVRFKRNT